MSRENEKHLPVETGNEAFLLMDKEDEKQILAEMRGEILKYYVYEFPDKKTGRMVRGLSKAGVDNASREMAKKGEILRCLEMNEIDEGEYFRIAIRGGRFVYDEKEGREIQLDAGFAGKRQWKKMKLKDGKIVDDPFWYEKAISKAERNMKRKLMPEHLIVKLIEKYLEEGRGKRLAPSENVNSNERDLLISEIKIMMTNSMFSVEECRKMEVELNKNPSVKQLRIWKEKIGERLTGKSKKGKADTDQKIKYDKLHQTLFEMLGAAKLRDEIDKLCKEFSIEKIEDVEKDAEMMGRVIVRMQEIRDNV